MEYVHVIFKPNLLFSDEELMEFPTDDEELNQLIRDKLSKDIFNFKNAGSLVPVHYEMIGDNVHIWYEHRDLQNLRDHLDEVTGDIGVMRLADLNDLEAVNDRFDMDLQFIDFKPVVESVSIVRVDGGEEDISHILDINEQ